MAFLYYTYLIQCESKFPSNLKMVIWWSKMFFSKLCCWKDFSKPSCEAKDQHSLGNENKPFWSSWYSMFWTQSFLFNSYVYYVTRSFIASTNAFNLLTRAFNLPTRGFNLPACAFSLLLREFELVTCGYELVVRGFELLTRGFELVTCGFEFVTRNSWLVFYFSTTLLRPYYSSLPFTFC